MALTATPASRLGYALVDADNHYYEPLDFITRHIEPRYADRAVHHVLEDDGRYHTYVGDRPFAYRPIALCDLVGAPGSTKNQFSPNPQGPASERVATIVPREIPAFCNDRAARLALMDEQGMQATLMFPTEFQLVEYELYHEGPEVAFANIRAFNRWMEEDWGFAYQERIFAVPTLSLADLDLGVAELERVLAAGARAVHVNPGPAHGRSPAEPYFDPFWSRVQEAGIPVVFHIANAGYSELVCTQWGYPAHPLLYDESAFQLFLARGARPIVDTMAALVLGDFFGRFPGIQVISVENGSSWVGQMLDDIDHAGKLSRVPWSSRDGKPSEVFREHVYVAPFWEDSGGALAELIGADHVLMGSDYPHPEGEAEPVDFVESLVGLDADQTRLVMRENMARLLKLGV
ncbi:MAG TPA: amidohydrolase family protein [Acidimicrobiales bacterium]|nr:amidohydrolase family protein [Acidimicrobiales bacterium]